MFTMRWSNPPWRDRAQIWWLKGAVLVCISLFSLLRSVNVTHAQSTPLQQARAAAVQIFVVDFDRERVINSGSGSLITEDGQVLTNYHVVAESAAFEDQVIVNLPLLDQENRYVSFLAEVVKESSEEDLALVQITSFANGDPIDEITFPAVTLGDSDTLLPGDDVYALGYPDYNPGNLTVTGGIVSGLVTVDGKAYISTDVAITNGNSGGMLINRTTGELVGIPTFVIDSEQLPITHGYARPSNVAKAFISGKGSIEILCADDFLTNVNKWPIGLSEGDLLEKETVIARGALHMDIQFHDDASGWINAPECHAQNFMMRVDAQFSAASDAEVGVVLLVHRAYDSEREEHHYLRAAFYADNSYEIAIESGDEWEILQRRTASRALRLQQGEVNQLAIIGANGMYTVFANETELTTVEDTTLSAGGFGLGITGDEGGSGNVLFDNFALSDHHHPHPVTVLLPMNLSTIATSG